MVAETVPRSVVLAAWWNSWSSGRCAGDDVVDALATFGAHNVLDRTQQREPLLVGLARIQRRANRTNFVVNAALPVPGDVSGLPGPPATNIVALAAGQALVCPASAVVLVPATEGELTTWVEHPADAEAVLMPMVRPEQSAVAVREALREATLQLERLDMAGDRHLVEFGIQKLRSELAKLSLPPSLPTAAAHTAHMAAQVLGIVNLAVSIDGHGSTLARSLRHTTLADLARTARHCLAAAVSAR